MKKTEWSVTDCQQHLTNEEDCLNENELQNEVYTVEDFKNAVRTGALTNDDGIGYPYINNAPVRPYIVYPSNIDLLPEYITHIIWYNK